MSAFHANLPLIGFASVTISGLRTTMTIIRQIEFALAFAFPTRQSETLDGRAADRLKLAGGRIDRLKIRVIGLARLKELDAHKRNTVRARQIERAWQWTGRQVEIPGTNRQNEIWALELDRLQRLERKQRFTTPG